VIVDCRLDREDVSFHVLTMLFWSHDTFNLCNALHCDTITNSNAVHGAELSELRKLCCHSKRRWIQLCSESQDYPLLGAVEYTHTDTPKEIDGNRGHVRCITLPQVTFVLAWQTTELGRLEIPVPEVGAAVVAPSTD